MFSRIFSLLVLLNFSFEIHANPVRSSYNLPNPDSNWIINVYNTGSIFIILHTKGAAISTDGGVSFKEFFHKNLQSGFNYIHINEDTNSIYLGTETELFVSKDLGQNFQKVKGLSPFQGIHSISSSIDRVYLTKNHSPGHDICDKNILYISDDGINFSEKEIGSSCTVVNRVTVIKNQVFVSVINESLRQALYVSKDGGEIFTPTSFEDELYVEALNEEKSNRESFKQKLSTQPFPPSKIYPQWIPNHFYISYNNAHFQTLNPQAGIVYEFIHRGAKHQIHSEYAPRFGGFNKAFWFFASFKDLWIESLSKP